MLRLPLYPMLLALFAAEPFATEVVDYSPAPGGFVCNASFNEPRALGPPSGGGTVNADLSSLVTLGGFGGSLTLRFDHVVEDDPLNRFGVDAIVYSNALWQAGDHDRHVAECATIEIALDTDGDGAIAEDEGWFLIPGSHLSAPEWYILRWANAPCPLDAPLETGAFMLPADPFGDFLIVNPTGDDGSEGIYGYAEYTPTLILGDLDGDNIVDDPQRAAHTFYTVPDDPRTVGVTAGAGGGDAFDIAWAIDPDSGAPAGLRGFDFIRLTTASHHVHPILGEVSAEIDAVADVAADPFGDCDLDRDIDLVDYACVQVCAGVASVGDTACAALDHDDDDGVTFDEIVAWLARLSGPVE